MTVGDAHLIDQEYKSSFGLGQIQVPVVSRTSFVVAVLELHLAQLAR
jgi:hypothetical protein